MKAVITANIIEAKKLLLEEEVVAIPTETVYGLAANAFSASAVAKIFAIKQRPAFNPLIIHSYSIEVFEKWGLSIPPLVKQLMQRFSPGPLTCVIPSIPSIPSIVTAGTNAVAIRIPAHPLTLSLLKELPFPLAAPSANPSGFVSPTRATHVADQLGDKIKLILDGGGCAVGLESTIVSFLHEQPKLLRYGSVSQQEMEQVIGVIENTVQYEATDNPVAPGMLQKHYATRHPLLVRHYQELDKATLQKNILYITYGRYEPALPFEKQILLSISENTDEIAVHLYHALRIANEMSIDLIVVKPVKKEGMGIAINDRLRRAGL